MLIKRSLQFLPAQLFAPLAQFASIIAWTYYCSAETIGLITLFAVFQELAQKIVFGWWAHYTIRYYGESEESWCDSDLFLVLLTAIQIVLSFFTLWFWFGSEFSWAFYSFVAFYMALRSLNQYFSVMFSIKGKAIGFNICSLSGPCVGLLISLILLENFGDDIIYLIVGFIIGECLSIAYFCATSNLVFKMISKSVIHKAFSYGVPLLVAGIFSWNALNISRFVVEWNLGLAAVGEFAVGFGLGQRAANLASMLVSPAALPLAMKKMRDEGEKAAMQQLGDNFSLLIAVMLPALVGVYMIKDEFLPLAISENFQASALLTFPWALLSGGLFAVIYHYCNHYFLVVARTKPLILVDLTLAVVVAFSSWWMVGAFGFVGGVISMVIASGAVMLAMLVYLVGFRGLIFPFKSFFITGLSVLTMSLGIEASRDLVPSGWLGVISLVLLGSTIYILVMYPFYKKGDVLKYA
ncbi:lipopolysaccharide biosynthesis protein [Vibrio sp. MA40-2]|uniref:lipopolysaccharide biosynthesis protein n=1 Tax=Vibrio sp. MA40-2 TaxID=3391828 RepID=UPI0039A716D5